MSVIVNRRAEEDEYSGLVSISIAKCQQQQQNHLLEALYYHRAGRFFMTSQTNVATTNAPAYLVCNSFWHEFIDRK
jgi:hypothetical protein